MSKMARGWLWDSPLVGSETDEGRGEHNSSVFILRPRCFFLTGCICVYVSPFLLVCVCVCVCVFVCVCVCVCVLTVVWLEQCYLFCDPHLSLRWQGALNNPAAVCVCLCVCTHACTCVWLLCRGALHVCGTVQPPVLFLLPWGDTVSQLRDDKSVKTHLPFKRVENAAQRLVDP